LSQNEKSFELQDKLVNIRRTAKVVQGGRISSFSAAVVVGNGADKIGFGIGKAGEISSAIKKATDTAKKSMVKIRLHNKTIQYPITEKFGATKVFMKPASDGTGVIAGGAMRSVFEVLGIENILAKTFHSTNACNVVIATINGLKKMETPYDIAKRRGKTINELLDLPVKQVEGK